MPGGGDYLSAKAARLRQREQRGENLLTVRERGIVNPKLLLSQNIIEKSVIPEVTNSQRRGSLPSDASKLRRDFSKDIAFLEGIMKVPRIEKTVAFTIRK
jgi:hypothetical protein